MFLTARSSDSLIFVMDTDGSSKEVTRKFLSEIVQLCSLTQTRYSRTSDTRRTRQKMPNKSVHCEWLVIMTAASVNVHNIWSFFCPAARIVDVVWNKIQEQRALCPCLHQCTYKHYIINKQLSLFLWASIIISMYLVTLYSLFSNRKAWMLKWTLAMPMFMLGFLTWFWSDNKMTCKYKCFCLLLNMFFLISIK